MRRAENYVIVLILFLSIFIIGCSNNSVEVTGSGITIAERESFINEKQSFPVKEVREINISSIGDILIHQPVYIDAWTGNNYNFQPMFEKMNTYLSAATITTANQESMIGGIDIGLSSYPQFNSPIEVGEALKVAGIDAIIMANNHTLDRGEVAIQNAIRYWEENDMTYVGASKDVEDKKELRIIETEEEISVAFLAYTYGTNGIPTPTNKEYLVNLIDREKMAKEIARAKQEADVIVLNLHFGTEYERLPNEEQKELAQFAADQGVHAIIGHHSHVLQPATWVEGKEGNKTLVVYSLGNFLSNQQELHQRIGGIFDFSVTKTTYGDQEKVELHTPTFLPTYVKFNPNWSDYQVIPMYQLTDDDLRGAGQHYEEIKAHMSQWLPELEFPES